MNNFIKHIKKEYSKDQYYTQKVKSTTYMLGYRLSSVIYRDLLQKIYNRSGYIWSVISFQFQNEDYVWWSWVNFVENRRLTRLVDELEMVPCDHGYPKNIMYIIEIINLHCYFNRRIRYFFTLITWASNIFIYYNRYYRYKSNNRLLGKKEHFDFKNGYKLHLVAYINHRQYTGHRLDKNHLRL